MLTPKVKKLTAPMAVKPSRLCAVDNPVEPQYPCAGWRLAIPARAVELKRRTSKRTADWTARHAVLTERAVVPHDCAGFSSNSPYSIEIT